jgi:Arc/MetJ family transcription regulator
MTVAREMLDAAPVGIDLDADAVAAAIERLYGHGASVCVVCQLMLAEELLAELRRCVALAEEWADVCAATVLVLSRPLGSDHRVTHRL